MNKIFPIKFKCITFGCKTNQCESNRLINELISYGFKTVDDPAELDIMIINSCAVTENSIKKLSKYLASIKNKNCNIKFFKF